MSFRNLSPQTMFELLARDHQPECAFRGQTETDFVAWKNATLPRVLGTLGDYPPRWQGRPGATDGLRTWRVVYVPQGIGATRA